MADIIVGMLAHVDAGKTTLTESLMFESGMISDLGRVDHGTAFLDTDDMEKKRGITIYSKEARFTYMDTHVTLLDTPGHIDFSPEMERTLSVIDYGILVVSGSEGIQSHTETLWNLLQKHEIPTILFVNKMDLEGSNVDEILMQLQERCSENCTLFSQENTQFFEDVALCDELIMNEFLENGTVSTKSIATMVQERKIFPCFFGSALKLEGVSSFLEGLATYCASPYTMKNRDFGKQKFGAKVFKITRDGTRRLTHLKVTSGNLAVRDLVGDEKISEIRLYSGNKFSQVDSVACGTICAVTGLEKSKSGTTLGVEKPFLQPILAPVLTYSIDFPGSNESAAAIKLLDQLKELQEEDPALDIQWLSLAQKIQIQIMGDVQIEILKQVVLQRFGVEIHFLERAIIYRETLGENQTYIGVGHFEPLRHYAEVILELSALPIDSGLRFLVAPQCPLPLAYQQLVLQHLSEKILTGTLIGAPLTDMKITLLDGKVHQKHTTGGDFREATFRALGQGLRQGTSVLLEPWVNLHFHIPTESVGRAMSDVQRMGGSVESPTLSPKDGTFSSIEGVVPLSQLGNYQNTVLGYTQGRGRLSTHLLGYRPCVNASSVIKKVDYSPDMDPHFCSDSIFCKHGAGFSVVWNDVHSYAHCNLPKEEIIEEPVEVHRQRVRHYENQLAEDADLLAIFQRTYGKIDPEKLQRPNYTKKKNELESSNHTSAYHAKGVPYHKKERYLLVDGYNIIFAWDDLKSMGEDHLDSARVALLNYLCNYQAFYHCQVIVVFDAYKVKGGTGSVESYYNITQVFTKEAETADMYIEKVTHTLGGSYEVRVATSDALEQRIILGHGALRLSANNLKDEIDRMNKAMSKFLS